MICTESKTSPLAIVGAATLLAATQLGCTSKPKEVGIEIRVILGPTVDMTKTAVLEIYLDERVGDPALFDVANTDWTQGTLNGVPYKYRHNDIDGDLKYELLFRIEQNVYSTSNAYTFTISGLPFPRPFRIYGRVFDSQSNLLGIGTSEDVNFTTSLQTVSIQLCPNNQCPQFFTVGAVDAGADAGIVSRDVQFRLSSGIDRSVISSFDFYFDEAVGYPSFAAAPVTTPIYGIINGIFYSYTLEDVDSDGKYELWVKIPTNIFATSSTFGFTLNGAPGSPPFHFAATVRNSSNAVLGTGYSAPIYVVSGLDAAVVDICLTSESCLYNRDGGTAADAGTEPSVDAGSDAGAGDAGADAGAFDAGADGG